MITNIKMKAALLLRGKIIYSDFQITFQITSDYISDFLLIPDRLKKNSAGVD